MVREKLIERLEEAKEFLLEKAAVIDASIQILKEIQGEEKKEVTGKGARKPITEEQRQRNRENYRRWYKKHKKDSGPGKSKHKGKETLPELINE